MDEELKRQILETAEAEEWGDELTRKVVEAWTPRGDGESMTDEELGRSLAYFDSKAADKVVHHHAYQIARETSGPLITDSRVFTAGRNAAVNVLAGCEIRLEEEGPEVSDQDYARASAAARAAVRRMSYRLPKNVSGRPHTFVRCSSRGRAPRSRSTTRRRTIAVRGSPRLSSGDDSESDPPSHPLAGGHSRLPALAGTRA